jgi:hypothetical protein
MHSLKETVRLRAGPVDFLRSVLLTAERHLGAQGLSLATLSHQEFIETNQRYRDRGWYGLNDNYRHERFLGLAIATADLGEVRAIVVSRPLDLAERSLGQALEHLQFAHPEGTAIDSADRFSAIPREAYWMSGRLSLIGGLWIDHRSAPRSGLRGSSLLSYLTRALYAVLVGTENPDLAICMVVDELLRGREKRRSILDRYGFQHVAKGPVWENHYPDASLPLNLSWVDRAAILAILRETPWISG